MLHRRLALLACLALSACGLPPNHALRDWARTASIAVDRPSLAPAAAQDVLARQIFHFVWEDLMPLSNYLVLGAILFALSVVGIFLNRKNVVILLMAIELNLLAVNMNLVAFSRYLGDAAGQVFVFFILTVAAAEAAIGLAILITVFRNRRTINVDDLDTLKG